MIRLHLRVPGPGEWNRFFDPSIDGGGIFCPTTEPPETGTPVRIEITFISGPRFFLNGTVVWRRVNVKDPRARAGVGVKIVSEDLTKINYVNAWVRGGVLDKRELRRLPLKLRVTYSGRSGRRMNFTRDVSEEGLFIQSRELLDIGTLIHLTLFNPRAGVPPLELTGTIARHLDSDGQRGMGIHLEFNDDMERRRFLTFVRKLEQEYIAGSLPEEVIG